MSRYASRAVAFIFRTINTIRIQIINSNLLDRRYRFIVFLMSFVAHVPFLFGRYLPRESLKYFSADENALIRVILRYQEHIRGGDWAALLSERLEYGYGYLYHLSYSILTYPFAEMAGDEGILAFGRLISTVLECGTVVFVCVIVRRLGVHAYVAVLVGVAMAFTPGLIVMHKPLSAEQLSNFLIVASAWAALAMPLQSFRTNLFLVSTLAGAAISVKFNAALLGPVFAGIILTRIYLHRGAMLASVKLHSKNIRIIAADFAVLAAGLGTFFIWNLPILVSARSRGHFLDWLVVQYESNQNSQKGKVNYRGIEEWWPKIDLYFGDNTLLPWLLLSAVVAGIIALFLKNGKTIAGFSIVSLLWVIAPSAYVIFSVKKIWLWYLVLPGFFLLVGPACLYATGQRLYTAGARMAGAFAGLAAVSFIVAHLCAVLPDYANFATQRWQETERPDFLDMEAMRIAVTREIEGNLSQTSIIVDTRVTLPLDEWRGNGAKISARPLPSVSEDIIVRMKPDYIIIRHWGYVHHHGNRKKALAEFQAKLDSVCEKKNLCYAEHQRYDLSKTLVYKIKS